MFFNILTNELFHPDGEIIRPHGSVYSTSTVRVRRSELNTRLRLPSDDPSVTTNRVVILWFSVRGNRLRDWFLGVLSELLGITTFGFDDFLEELIQAPKEAGKIRLASLIRLEPKRSLQSQWADAARIDEPDPDLHVHTAGGQTDLVVARC